MIGGCLSYYILYTVPYHTLFYLSIPYSTISYHIELQYSYCTIAYNTAAQHTVPYRTVPYRTIPYRNLCIIQLLTVPYNIIVFTALYSTQTVSPSIFVLTGRSLCISPVVEGIYTVRYGDGKISQNSTGKTLSLKNQHTKYVQKKLKFLQK